MLAFKYQTRVEVTDNSNTQVLKDDLKSPNHSLGNSGKKLAS